MKQTTRLRRSGGPTRSQSGRPSREAAEQLYGRILDSAAELFTRHGYGETSIEAVAAHAGVGKLTLYRRFADKDVLFDSVVRRLRDESWTSIAQVDDVEGSLPDVLTAVGRRLLGVVLSPPSLAFHRILFAEAARLPEFCASIYSGTSPDGPAPIHRVFRRFAEHGALRGEDVAFLSQQFIQAIVGNPLRNALLGAPPMSAHAQDDHVRKAVKLFLGGMTTWSQSE